jgi:hypothetical protein
MITGLAYAGIRLNVLLLSEREVAAALSYSFTSI